MRIEELTRYAPSAVPGDKGRGLIVKLEPSEDGEAVLLKHLPQKIKVSEEKPNNARPVLGYFSDGCLDGVLVCYRPEFREWRYVSADHRVDGLLFWRDLLY